MKEFVSQEFCDGYWIAPLVDHMSAYLSQLALLADTVEVAEKAESDEEDQENTTKNKHIEKAQQEMAKACRGLKSQKTELDSRTFAQLFVNIRIVRIWFKLNNFKQSKVYLDSFLFNLESMEMDLSQVPA